MTNLKTKCRCSFHPSSVSNILLISTLKFIFCQGNVDETRRYLSKQGTAIALQKLRFSFSFIVFRMDCSGVPDEECGW